MADFLYRFLSGRRESDPLHSPWQGDILPMNYSRLCAEAIIYFEPLLAHFIKLMESYQALEKKSNDELNKLYFE